MLLSFDTKNQIITRTDANRAIANSTDYFEVSVTFSANWNGYDKTICFKNGDTEINIMLVNNAVPKEAHLNLGVGTWKVSIIGIKGNHKILTNAVNLPVGASGYIGTTGPTPRVYEELLTIIQSLHTEVASEAALRSAVEQFVDENFHDIVISDVYSKSEIDSMIVTKTVNDLVYYWNKSQTYNRAEIEALIEAAIQGTYIVVQTLPTTDISTHAIYLVPKESATVGDYYNEYINTTGTSAGWEHIGTTEIDLSNYYTKAEINALLDNKVDKVSGKGLSTNDYDNTAKSIVDGVTSALANKVDKETGKGLSTNDYDNTAKGIVDGVTAALSGKVDKETGKGLSTNDYDNTEKAKLAGIAENATKTEASLTNGNIKINGSETVVYNDTELDSRVDTVEQDLSTDTTTVEGNPLNFTTLSAQKAVETVISLAPIQDLHGYDYPWPGGGWKNKLPMTVDGIKASNTSGGTWSGNTYTRNGVSLTIQTDDGNNVISILVNGTATAGFAFNIKYNINLESDDYILSVQSSFVWGASLYATGNGGSHEVSGDITSKSFTDNIASVAMWISNNKSFNNFVVQPMLRLATETDPTFAPYSNICPIDGRTETSLVGLGKNLISAIEANAYNNDGTTYVAGSRCRTPIFFIKNGVYTLQANTTASGKTIQAMYETWKNDSYTNNEMLSESQYASGDQTITIESDTYISMVYKYSDNSIMSYTELKSQLELGSQATDYEPFVQSNNLTIQFGEKVYGAKVELEKGTVTVECGYIAEYNGETLPGEWISDRDVYAPNTSPSTGAEVAYELATPRTIQLTPNEISLLKGVSNISTDGDSISLTYRDGKVATLGDLDGLVKKIADCEDVEITDLQASDVLVWDATAGKWKNQENTSAVHYDDTERIIGTWFGETLYQKTIEIASAVTISASQWATIYTDSFIGEIKQIVFSALQNTNNGGYYDCAYYRESGNNLEYYFPSTGNFTISAGAKITLQYTKTTPTLLMQSTPTEESTPADESDSTDENR